MNLNAYETLYEACLKFKEPAWKVLSQLSLNSPFYVRVESN